MKLHIRHLKSCASTNDLAWEAAAEGAAEGLVLAAGYQTRGRGKPGNEWISPAGKNLLFSLLLRPKLKPHQAPMLTQTACRSVARVLLDRCGISSRFKRPNDILVEGKKICGILVETQSSKARGLDCAVVGVGLNVNVAKKDLFPGSTSLRALTKKSYHRKALLHAILEEFQKDLQTS